VRAGRDSRLLAWGVPLGPLMANAYLVADEVTREAVVVDPGQDPAPFLARLREEGWRVRALVCTHAHFDHIGGAREVQAATGAVLCVPAAEHAWLLDPARNLSAALTAAGVPEVRLDGVESRPIEGGWSIALGSSRVVALSTPGHTPGGLSYHVADLGETGAVFTGDTLFAGTIGRTDLPGGDPDALMRSIRTALLSLPEGTIVFPGHGRATTVGEEREFNPFLGG
jgi:hydroxyacylglutathione hydrolase